MNDVISRKAAIDAHYEYCNQHPDAGFPVWSLKILKDLPSAQPQRTGRWELIDDTEFRIPGYRCSVCHCECEDWDKKPTYRFCPNCGARMEGD